MVLMLLMRALMSVCTVLSSTILKRVGLNISPIVRPTLIGKVLTFAELLAVLQHTIPSATSRNLNFHMSNIHGWKEQHA